MNILIVYDSWTGHTRSLCSAAAHALARLGHDTHLYAVSDGPDVVDGYDLVIVGTPVHFGPTSRVKAWLRRAGPIPVMAIILSYGAPGAFGRYTLGLTIDSLRYHAGSVISVMAVPGFHPILRTFHGRPDEADMVFVQAWARGLTKNAHVYSASNPWVNQNLPFFCGLAEGIQGSAGLPPDQYIQDPDNPCSSKKWYTRGYQLTNRY